MCSAGNYGNFTNGKVQPALFLFSAGEDLTGAAPPLSEFPVSVHFFKCTLDFLTTPAPASLKPKIGKHFLPPWLFLSLAEAVAAATSGQKPAEISSFSQALAKSVGQIYISGKPTQTKMVVLAALCVRGKKCSEEFIFPRLFLFFFPKKALESDKLSKKRREGKKTTLNAERTDEGAKKCKERQKRKKNITGGQLSWLFLEDCFSILQSGWREQGGSVWQLAERGGGRRYRRREGEGRERRRSERVHGTFKPKDCPVH